MKCIYCGYKDTDVTNSRKAKKGAAIWRRRTCPGCDETFTTKETAQNDNLFVIKSSGKRQRFVYEKLFVSLFTILNTQKNPDNGDNALLAKKLAETILKKIFMIADDKNVSTGDIIKLAYVELAKVDTAYAEHYIYYSSYRRKVGIKAKLIS